MRKEKLINKTLTHFVVCVSVLLLLATPLFYVLVKNLYAEDILDLIEAIQRGKPMPNIDFEEDLLSGVMLQFVLIASILGIAIVFTLRFISKKLWKPFDDTLQAMETFRLEDNRPSDLPDCDITEFSRLNAVFNKLTADNLHSYRVQKEFTENASHELQTPLAVFQSKLDLLVQQPNLTEEQALIIQDLNLMCRRLARLNRNLLLLAKMDNGQFAMSKVDLVKLIGELRPYFEALLGNITMKEELLPASLLLNANKSLLESLLSNLVVNAVRHNKPQGEINLTLRNDSLVISNTSDEAPLDEKQIFNRFFHSTANHHGNGLGLAIVKAICDYHAWCLKYDYKGNRHVFTITFPK